jgi:hypothetical protein
MPTLFGGPAYDPALDKERLLTQLGRVYDVMSDGAYRTLAEIAAITRDHEASISAQLRHLRKPRFGSHRIEKQRRGEKAMGLWEYRMLPKAAPVEVQQEMFAEVGA